MAQILAVEWDTNEIRLVTANLRGSEVTVEEARSFPFAGHHSDLIMGGENSAAEEADPTRSETLNDALAAALEGQGVSRANVLFAIPRSSVEVRVLQVPSVPDDELPELVRFQALQKFSTMGANWPLDFVTLAGDSNETTQSVLATTISPELVNDIIGACEASDLTATRLVLRPFAAGSLVQRALGSQLPACCLVVELLGKEADLTVLQSGQVVFMRTIRLPSESVTSTQSRAILGELRRTVAAAQNQMHGTSIDQVILCGDSELHRELKTLIPQDLSLQTTSVKPFDQVSLGRDLQNDLPANLERYTALLGMLQDEADSASHAVNFLAPRKAPEAASMRRRNLFSSVAIAACLLMALVVWYGKLKQLDSEINSLQATSAQKERFVTDGREIAGRLKDIHKFTRTNVVWLDELARLSNTEIFPGPEKAVTNRILMTSRTEGGGKIAMELHISENAATNWGPIIGPLRDPRHRIQDSGLKGDLTNRDYPWILNQGITILPEPEKPETPALQRPRRSPSAARQPSRSP